VLDIAKALTSPHGASARPRFGLDDDQAVAPLRPPTREQNPKQSIPKAKARATSSAALEHGDLMVQRDLYSRLTLPRESVPARRFPMGRPVANRPA
jgi:hypothetical protein